MWVYVSQIEFAEKLGLAPRAYANYERGEREMPAAVLLRLYELFSIDPVWLLTGTATAKDAVIPELHTNRQRALAAPMRWRDNDLHVVSEGGETVEQPSLRNSPELSSQDR